MRIVITGAEGQLGVELVPALAAHGEVIGTTLADLDVTNPGCADFLAGLRPDWVVHAAAATDVDGCERDPEWAMAVNAEGTRRVAEGCRRAGAGLLYLSTDYVFDGRKGTSYTESDAPVPLNVYGRSKLEGERATRSLASRWVIIRTAWLYGTHGRNFVKTILGKVAAGEQLRVVDDQVGSPTYAKDLADAVGLLLSQGLTGLFHVTNSGSCSWYEFAREILRLTGDHGVPLHRISSAELDRPARRPAYSVLENAAWRAAGFPRLRPWSEALAAMLAALRSKAQMDANEHE
ncbi:MAG: dTDP-4-dehydrorhamnose reductase [candidate division NC10 bacterium]|nr:dTDP-4-dehydrorhamnose reductase [candidate division NC10 bacterium]